MLSPFHAHEKALGRDSEIGVSHEQVLRKRERSFHMVDLWTATGIRIQPNQQIVAKSLAAYWNGQKEKLDKWMQDWLASSSSTSSNFRPGGTVASDPSHAKTKCAKAIKAEKARKKRLAIEAEFEDLLNSSVC